METIYIALIVAGSTTLSPLFLAYLTDRLRRRERKEDIARQDEVANRVATAAQALVESNAVVADAAKETIIKLDVIHGLVNSSMTAAMQSESDAISRELVLMLEIVALNKAAGRSPSIDALAQIESTKLKIAELKTNLAERSNPTP